MPYPWGMNADLLNSLFATARIEEALAAAKAWCSAEPASVLAWQYCGNAELWLGRPDGAEACYRRALSLAPGEPRSEANLALALLGQGRFAEAWPRYETRYDPRLVAHDQVRFALPPARQWQGEPLAGRRLLLVREQGFGDLIQFIRYAAALKAHGAGEVVLWAPSPLAGLAATAPGVDRVITTEPPATDYDLWTPLLSLPLRLASDAPLAPPALPYLQADPARCAHWRGQLDAWAAGKRRIGLAWAGSAGNAINVLRSLPIAHVLQLLERRPPSLAVSLQLGEPGMQELATQCQRGMVPLLDLLTDFGETAAVMHNLDLIITVDTAVAHLAGALGRPTWVLLPVAADWRWRLQDGVNPWYPTLRHFRQTTPGDWAPVIDEVVAALHTWMSA